MKHLSRAPYCLISRSPAWIVVFAVAFCLADASARAQDEWGHLAGRIVVDGVVPQPAELTLDGEDRQFCLRLGEEFRDRSLLVGSDGGLQNAYLMMYFARGDDRRPTVHPSYAEAFEKSVVIANDKCRFEPHAVFLRTGQTLSLQNKDVIGHNCHVVMVRNEENLNLASGASIDISFDESERVPGIIKCDIHKWMEGIVLLRDEPYAAVTDDKGQFKIENLPVGTWSFQFWHKRVGYMQALKRDGEKFLGRRGEFEVEIEPGKTLDLGELTIAAEELTNR